jgi:hypothetical protein
VYSRYPVYTTFFFSLCSFSSLTGIRDIEEVNRNKHYQIACGKVFQFTHKLPTNSVGINHPNQYFEVSQKLRHGDNVEELTGELKLRS